MLPSLIIVLVLRILQLLVSSSFITDSALAPSRLVCMACTNKIPVVFEKYQMKLRHGPSLTSPLSLAPAPPHLFRNCSGIGMLAWKGAPMSAYGGGAVRSRVAVGGSRVSHLSGVSDGWHGHEHHHGGAEGETGASFWPPAHSTPPPAHSGASGGKRSVDGDAHRRVLFLPVCKQTIHNTDTRTRRSLNNTHPGGARLCLLIGRPKRWEHVLEHHGSCPVHNRVRLHGQELRS